MEQINLKVSTNVASKKKKEVKSPERTRIIGSTSDRELRHDKVQNTLEQLIKTEQEYVKTLEQFVVHIYQPLAESNMVSKKTPIVSKKKLKDMFPHIVVNLMQIHTLFLHDLKPVVTKEPSVVMAFFVL